MATKISKYQEIMGRLENEKKTETLDKPEDIQAMEVMNSQAEAVRRDYQVKDQKSQSIAQYVILNS